MNKGLEVLEKIKNSLLVDGRLCLIDNVRGQIIEKELKALGIIKEMLDNDLTEKLNANSRKIFKDIFDNLPKEKQDLLKEVLR